MGRRALVVALLVCALTWSSVPEASAAPIGPVQHVQVGDISVGYREGGSGSGPPLVLIMGYGGAMYEWDPALLERLADQRRVVVFDNRGVATTSGPTAGLTVEMMADDTAGLIEALGLGQVDLLGWSMGGYVAQEVVLRHPELVNRLILSATDPGSPRAVQPSPAVIALLESATRNGLIEAIFPQTRAARAAAKAYLARVAAQPGLQPSYFEVSPETIRAQLGAELAWNRPGAGSYASLGRIAQPTLVIDGALDRAVPPVNSRIIADRIPSSLLKLYPGAGHAFMYQYPALVSKNIGAFLG
jgi:pimeloyl-ACP methyl ester carboxylesterase